MSVTEAFKEVSRKLEELHVARVVMRIRFKLWNEGK
jgi:hypothetical protein